MKSNYQENTSYFKHINSHIKAYYLGFIAADGCITQLTKYTKGLTITIHEKDAILLYKLKEEIGCSNKIMYLKNNLRRFQIGNSEIYNDLLNHGVTPRKSLTLGNLLPNIPKKYRPSYILGYFDGDGSVMLPLDHRKPNMNTKRIVVDIRGSESLLEGIAKELRLNQYSIKRYDSTPRLTFSKKSEVLKFFNICYKNCPIYLKRKYDRFLKRID